MTNCIRKRESRERRKRRIRKKVFGSPSRPRLTVYKSLKHIYAQIIDDTLGRCLVAASTLDPEWNGEKGPRDTKEAASKVGLAIARKAVEKQIKMVVFDRNAYSYHGRVKALADACRKGGLVF